MIGDSDETLETCMETVNWFLSHPEYNIFLNRLACYPGSEIYWRAVREGIIPSRVECIKSKFTFGSGKIVYPNCTKMTDNVYHRVMTKILPSVKAEKIRRLPAIKNLTVDFCPPEYYSIKGVCVACSDPIQYGKVREVGLFGRVLCPSCAELHRAFMISKQFVYEHGILRLVEKYGVIAFWGMGLRFKSLIKPAMLPEEGVVLLDTEKEGYYGDISIQRPEVLREMHIPLVVVSFGSDMDPAVQQVYDKIAGLNSKTESIGLMRFTAACFTLQNLR